MKQKVVWPLNLQYQVWEISEKCTHPFGKILYGTICMFAKLRFSSSENIYLEKKKLKVFISMQSFPSPCPKCGFCSFWPSETQLAVQPLSGSVPRLGTFRFKVSVHWDWWFKYLCLVFKKRIFIMVYFQALNASLSASAALPLCRLCHHFIRPFMESFFHSDVSVFVRNDKRRSGRKPSWYVLTLYWIVRLYNKSLWWFF